MNRFADRAEAGRALAALLAGYRGDDVLVLALPRGGVSVAAPVADALGAELDVVVARKLGAPGQPEFGVGAIAEGDVRVLDEAAIAALRIGPEALRAIESLERDELLRRVERYRAGRPAPRVEGRVVILVDDGIATGGTARAAILHLRAQRPARLVLAVPVAPPDTLAALSPLVEEVVCPMRPLDFRAVGLWYERFDQVDDAEVARLLAAARNVELRIPADGVELGATLHAARGQPLVVFAHGSGSSRRSPRNRAVAATLRARGMGTLLLDLLTPREEAEQDLRFEIGLLARRLDEVARWAEARGHRVALFGSSTGAAAALVAASRLPVAAVVSRGGRPDLAGDALPRVRAPTLLLVGGADADVLALNREAMGRMRGEVRLDVIPGATHLFEEPGALDEVATRAASFFAEHFHG